MSKEIPAFVFQFKEEPESLIETIKSLSPIYCLSKRDEKTIVIIQSDRSLPLYGEPRSVRKGDYIVPDELVNGRITFTVMHPRSFERKYLAGRA